MLDISKKFRTHRTAKAQAILTMRPETIARLNTKDLPKGDPLPIAKAAGVLAAKRTWELIPYCHPISIAGVEINFQIEIDRVVVTTSVTAVDRTGVEMEALTAASISALTIYDMIKPVDPDVIITSVKLVEKKGGKSDYRENLPRPLRAAVLVMSDSISQGKKEDRSGRMIVQRLQEEGLEVVDYCIIPDEPELIVQKLINYCDQLQIDLVLTTGGTGFSPRDRTPEAMAQVIERFIPGIPEAVRSYGQERTPYSMLSRAQAGIRGNTIIINLPGSSRGVAESLDLLFPALLHAFPMLWGTDGWSKHKREG